MISRFGNKAWEELRFAAEHIAGEPTQFVDPATQKLGLKNRKRTAVLPAIYHYLWDYEDGLCHDLPRYRS